jgi:DNA polymerase V
MAYSRIRFEIQNSATMTLVQVLLSELIPAKDSLVRETLFDGEEIETLQRRERIQGVLDEMSLKFGKGTLNLASAKVSNNWHMKRDRISPCCTTRWEDVLKVN